MAFIELEYLLEDEDEEVLSRPSNKGESLTANSAKKRKFNTDEKIKLAACVEMRPSLWNLGDKDHQNTNAVAAAWKAVGHDMHKTVEECKTAWKSLKDSRRYHTKTSKRLKSGSERLSEEDNTNDTSLVEHEVDWELSEHMAFLEQPRRRTFSSSDSATGLIDETSSPVASNYSYESYTTTSRKKNVPGPDRELEQLSSNISKLIEIRNKEVELPPAHYQKELKNYSTYLFLDEITENLTRDQQSELNLKYLQLAYEAVRSSKEK